ncbi:16S rRNA (cytosine(967)-C(5))-methyltransferase RsmB [Texcoconibacillus texcoconensis]|uniref:16S rRNA (cytosine(967)-C(5))-methyltransferase n=1 Tax=Texcoconibacillus texcoconensis TaxID=1095777 RepID=A0A840QL94_9BACI|nr:16S rRNA (cytosine(967)-C(5))-methyltransferase RsmB [Texcoconibacillus texcoconensis]MBB5172130.1 16S rRNA (cytosine967-C5)-methyltransferase [Texcoconibacillus texcoconensis]
MKKMNVREAALEVLEKIEKNQAYSHLLLNHTIKKANLSSKDVPLLTEIVYGTLQRKKTIDFYLSSFVKRKLDRIDTWVLVLLRISVYQIHYLEKIPDRAVVHEAVEIAKRRGHKGIANMVNGTLRSMQRSEWPEFSTIKDPVERLAVETSHPDWLMERWIDQYGFDKARDLAVANLQSARQTARVNTTKTSVDEVLNRLADEGIHAEKGHLASDNIVVMKGTIAATDTFKDGFVTIQDEGSMLVTEVLAPKPGETVLDACAAPGGKTTHIAERLLGRGKVHALDVHDHKVSLIDEQAKRLGLSSIIKAQTLDARRSGEQFKQGQFDRILLDAPCSGLGVLRRKPDIKWTKSVQDIENITNVQTQLLDAVAPLLKVGGTLVYSTCTIDKSENDWQIEQFLKRNPEFIVHANEEVLLPKQIGQHLHDHGKIQLFPDDTDTDGFFIVKLEKQH